MRLLIVSYYFPPRPSIAGLRPQSWARTWTQAGHDVTVLTAGPSWFGETTEDAWAPLAHDAEIWRVPFPDLRQALMASPSAPDASRSTHPRGWRARFNAWRAETGALSTARLPDFADLWAPLALARARRAPPWDAVVSTYGPYATHAIAHVLRRAGHAERWVADYRDLWTQSVHFRGVAGLRTAERVLERALIRRADAVTTVSAPFADRLEAQHGRPVTVVPNGYDPEDRADRVTTTGPRRRGAPLRLLYTGTRYPTQDPSPLFWAIADLPSELRARVEVHFMGADGGVGALAARAGVGSQVTVHGVVPREVALRAQEDADGLLLLTTTSAGVTTGKVFEYLTAGPPILEVGPAQLGPSLAARTGRGVTLGDEVATIRDALVRLDRGSLRLPDPVEPVATYERSTLAAQMLTVVTGDPS